MTPSTPTRAGSQRRRTSELLACRSSGRERRTVRVRECQSRADGPQGGSDRRWLGARWLITEACYRLSISRITITIRMMAIRLKQIDEMLQPRPGCDAAAVLIPRAAIAIANVGTHCGTRARSRRDANQSRIAPTRSVAASTRRIGIQPEIDGTSECCRPHQFASDTTDSAGGSPPPGASVTSRVRTVPAPSVNVPVSSRTVPGLSAGVTRTR